MSKPQSITYYVLTIFGPDGYKENLIFANRANANVALNQHQGNFQCFLTEMSTHDDNYPVSDDTRAAH
mgnify:CR=1 FL=1